VRAEELADRSSCFLLFRFGSYCMAAAVQILFVCIFLGGIIVRLFNDIADDTAGSAALAYRYLGLRSVDDIVVIMIVIAFAMLLVLFLTVSADAYMHIVQARLRNKWSVATMEPPHVVWKLRGIYACFLSHYKMGAYSGYGSCTHSCHFATAVPLNEPLPLAEAASEARFMHDVLRKMLRTPVFLE
jgi:hypothetical protein